MAVLQKTNLDNKHTHPRGIENLVKQIQTYYPSADLDIINKAYTLAKRAHTGQYRKDGSPFMSHPLCVASILAELKLDLYTIVTGLLHDVVEDTSVSLDIIKEQFNDTVAFLVDGVSKVSQINFKNTQKKDSENMRKMIVAMACDVRVILVKIADRLHNMRTLVHLPPEKRLKVAQETLDIYAPLASRLGIHSIKVELEDLAFQHSDSEAYYSLMKQIDSEKKDMEKYIAEVIHILEKEITTQMNMKVKVTGRPKNVYSIYQKMITQNMDYNEVYDILAFRVCVNKVEECYKILGLIHSLWKPIPGRFKDYIAIPKQNNYQSLHTTVLGEKGKRIEIQIRTHEMHILAERGIAAHWKYKTESWKNKTTLDNETLKQFNWLQDLVSLHRQNTHSGEFLESVKVDLFDSDIYIFTPGGDVKEFPKGATPIDFAYCIHTDLGHRITGAKVNGRLVPLKYKLRNGDTVEVITSKNQTPSEEWLKYCITSKAKSKIKSFLKMESRKRALEIGQKLMEKEMKREDLKVEEVLKMPLCIKYMKDKGINTKEDLYTQLGYGKLLVKDLIEVFLPEKKKEDEGELESFPIESPQKKRSEIFCPVVVEGLGNILVHFAKCCRPLPGDAITGFISRGKGIVIHRQACRSLLSMDSERYVDVQWNQDRRVKHKHIVNIRVVSHDVPGVLKHFSEVFAEQNMNICNLKVASNKDMKAVSIFSVEVQNLKQLQIVLRSLKSLKNVISVSREGTT
ncbi:MAG: bifunctional (p)ppGpp synthetase/guanosine-3',5'-bis(diphosphate) 3'-pyrophosphohydrolase [Bdellovibrionales bacterium]|nr:bifunctional (p)ppGpp synthetase/guanosine-3',5'-bis(diphosphate) 3'-pyrophosphohydrolase [Bdellovibrionales bacterium]